jgi:hypothetical protein
MPNGSVDSILRTGWQCQHQGAQEDHEARTRLKVQRDSTNEEWSMDFVAARLLDARWFLVQTLVDPFPREFLLDLTDSRLTGPQGGLGVIAGHCRARCAGVRSPSITWQNLESCDGGVGLPIWCSTGLHPSQSPSGK